ncbi:hypothetical protein PV08_01436 [Exophiala spinifera]|uniref:REJ domain-containing protein n=1 Tax=Exophiala spinifera TaxID=91928 RepID=A0A0D2BPI9_9EURO|nr:uncharacterized protein PV08_01436 [Exophiala spinifera]KIW20858.1 hypothetical protein PV08_01436 [Exophiala spinifera]
MRPVENELFGLPKEERENRPPTGTDNNPSMPSSRIRGMHSEDSWIEIPSRPSSSSLSSASNDIITTGLQIRPLDERLSRQRHTSSHLAVLQPRATSTAGSSQDEYEESESDSDRVLSSSNEDISQDEAADDDDTSTALGVGTMDKVFTPQPNAFSHPPSSQQRTIPDSYFPPAPASAEDRPSNQRTITQRSYQRQTQSRQRTYTSSYQPDHDAALRASLTTLLSCAAAVRPKGLEPRPGAASAAAPVSRPSAQPTSLRLVAECEIDSPSRPRPKRTSSPKQTKRKSRESSKERHSKKVRPAKAGVSGEEIISPTLASWMISAGVVLVFSAISFSAGYAWGREVGRIEGEMALTGGNCSREAMRGTGSGLRRLRWTSAAASSISA